MQLKTYIANRLREVFLDGKLVSGTNFKEQIMKLPWEDAIKSINGRNSIATLTYHINYYVKGVGKVLDGGTLEIKDKYSFDAPKIESQKDWQKRVGTFCEDAEHFVSLVEDLQEEDLFKPFVDEKYGNYLKNLDLMIEHTYYHLGQIVLINKMLSHKN